MWCLDTLEVAGVVVGRFDVASIFCCPSYYYVVHSCMHVVRETFGLLRWVMYVIHSNFNTSTPNLGKRFCFSIFVVVHQSHYSMNVCYIFCP